jgi:DNA-binding SARP family transcriptional activator/tetratricopeptide (TPR) repeat protein
VHNSESPAPHPPRQDYPIEEVCTLAGISQGEIGGILFRDGPFPGRYALRGAIAERRGSVDAGRVFTPHGASEEICVSLMMLPTKLLSRHPPADVSSARPSLELQVEFRIFGFLEVHHHGKQVKLGGPRQQVALAMMLLEPGKVIPMSRLIDAIWDGDPPTTARAQVQICVSNLRRSMVAVGVRGLIETYSHGYLLRLSDSTLDLREFEAAVAAGRRSLTAGNPAEAAAQFRSGLALWRGPVLGNISSALVQNSVVHIEQLRLSVLESCLQVELLTGPVEDLVGELDRLTGEYPLRERFRALLMTALYRAGRRAEALEVYRSTHSTLSGELGIEPGGELKELHQAMLLGHQVPDAPGLAVPAWLPQQAARPRLLPADIPDFTGRAKTVDAIVKRVTAAASSRQSDHAVPVHVLFGQGGAGKTTFAVHIAHQLADQFPDGQLFARLRVGGQSACPYDVLGRFLRALGVDGSSLPDGIEERAEMYRNLLNERKVLVVLDDAISHEQIAPLLPGSSTCAVLVTNRKRLAGLAAANRYEIGAFSQRTAMELLTRVVGADWIKAEPEAAETLCRLCGNLPLTLRIVAARLTARPHWSVAGLVERLASESRRLDELSYGDMSVRASIEVSYNSLSPDARRLLRLLALSEAPDFAAWVGAPLLQVDVVSAAELMEELVESYLIDAKQGPAVEPVRYRFHDMTLPFARERLLREESPQERHAALERLLGALLYLVDEARRREYSGDYLISASMASRWRLPEQVTSQLLQDPLTWYERERLSITMGVGQAAASGLVEHSWDLAQRAVTLFETCSYFRDWRTTHEVALEAACRAGDRRGEAAMRCSLGSLYMSEQRNSLAAAQFAQAGQIYADLGDEYGAALVMRNGAILERRGGNLERALIRSRTALEVFRAVGDHVGQAHVLHNMAQVWLDYGAEDIAGALLDQAAAICRQTGNRRVHAQVQRQLGDLRLRQGDLDQAADAYSTVLSIVRESHDRVGECYALLGIGRVDIRRGRPDSAERLLAGVLKAAEEVGDLLAESMVALALAEANLAATRLGAAADCADRALRQCERAGAVLLTVQVLLVRGKIHRAADEAAQASRAWDRARQILEKVHLNGAVTLSAELNLLQTCAGPAVPAVPSRWSTSRCSR